MKELTSRRLCAVALVKDEGRTMASVGREFGVTARTVRRWIDTADAAAANLRRNPVIWPLNTAADRQRAVGLVVDDNRTLASVGREFGVSARTVRRWIDVVYPPPPRQDMQTVYGPTQISHAHGSTLVQKYDDLNWKQRLKLRDRYVEHFHGVCMYCHEQLDSEPASIVRDSTDEIAWDVSPGFKEGFLKNPVHLHHDHNTGLTLGPVHALCNAHSWHFFEVPQRMQKLIDNIESLPEGEREKEIERIRKRLEA
jgi:transposase-like protein